jgi:hypothetical protein
MRVSVVNKMAGAGGAVLLVFAAPVKAAGPAVPVPSRI